MELFEEELVPLDDGNDLYTNDGEENIPEDDEDLKELDFN